MQQFKKRLLALPVIISLTAVVAVAGGMVVASIPAPDGTITGCYQQNNGQLRVVESASQCHPSETSLTWNQEGPQGPAGPQGPIGPQGPEGPQGPAGASSSGPPYVWVCTPFAFANVGSNTRADILVFNGSAQTANVAVNILDKFGGNLAGHNVPGSNPVVQYGGQAGATTVAVAPANTLVTDFQTAQTGPPQNGLDGVTDVALSVRVTSDQPVVVGANLWWGSPSQIQCSPVPR